MRKRAADIRYGMLAVGPEVMLNLVLGSARVWLEGSGGAVAGPSYCFCMGPLQVWGHKRAVAASELQAAGTFRE